MVEENAKKIWKLILLTGDSLKDKLPEHSNHPKGRNSYAHISLEIKNKFGCSYKDVPDDRIQELTDYIKFLGENPY